MMPSHSVNLRIPSIHGSVQWHQCNKYCSSATAGSGAVATAHDKPWLLLRSIAIGPDCVTLVFNF
jgi:hypothetical protein